MVEIADWALRLALWSFILAVSVAAVVRMFRRGRLDEHSQVGLLPKRLRDWMLGESSRKRRP